MLFNSSHEVTRSAEGRADLALNATDRLDLRPVFADGIEKQSNGGDLDDHAGAGLDAHRCHRIGMSLGSRPEASVRAQRDHLPVKRSEVERQRLDDRRWSALTFGGARSSGMFGPAPNVKSRSLARLAPSAGRSCGCPSGRGPVHGEAATS